MRLVTISSLIGCPSAFKIPLNLSKSMPAKPKRHEGPCKSCREDTADTILILINNLSEIPEIEKEISKSPAKRIIVYNKIDKLSEKEQRKISSTLQSKKYNFVLISTKNKKGIEELKNKIFQSFDKIRIYTKEPGKQKSPKPIIMKPNSTVKDVAEKILKGFSEKVKETRIWGPSSKFAGQKIGLKHQLRDMDIVEFKTK